MAKKPLEPIFKNKEDTMNCGNYQGIKLMCDSMKLYEKVHENRLRNIVSGRTVWIREGEIHNWCYFCANTAARKIRRMKDITISQCSAQVFKRAGCHLKRAL